MYKTNRDRGQPEWHGRDSGLHWEGRSTECFGPSSTGLGCPRISEVAVLLLKQEGSRLDPRRDCLVRRSYQDI